MVSGSVSKEKAIRFSCLSDVPFPRTGAGVEICRRSIRPYVTDAPKLS
ncbi:hypothetical protein B4168_1293 [Anoxybacillus flavithermus]|nr:hypothetical protein B4168_1293 [Anoxybacillus flavithermus]OAO83674.1 hypothetical protein GT23_4168 [Parageobacillus thermoglucosidasius]